MNNKKVLVTVIIAASAVAFGLYGVRNAMQFPQDEAIRRILVERLSSRMVSDLEDQKAKSTLHRDAEEILREYNGELLLLLERRERPAHLVIVFGHKTTRMSVNAYYDKDGKVDWIATSL